MKKVLISFVILLIFACSGDGIEGNVGDILKVSVEKNEENTKYDYKWTLEDQPDGSLINSDDLIITENGQEMSFEPDYPGEYFFQAELSQYGDPVSTQTFHFTISDDQNIDKKDSNDSKEDSE